MLLALWWLPRRPVGARRALLLALGLALLVGWEPLPDTLLRHLEDRHKPPGGSLQRYVGIVVLGGAIDPPHKRPGRDQVSLNQAAERMTVPVALMRQYPHLRLLFTGGDSGLIRGGTSEASSARVFFASLGVDPNRVHYQSESRTTYEDAVLTTAIEGVDKTQPWLLVTSAWHMPRSLATFNAAGWNVTPFPVDYLTGNHTPWMEYALVDGAFRWQIALHEYLGWLAYAAAGRAAL
jgi:uncharacterized SAM-binding protein YcdF (DUF218 family)